AGHGVTLNLGVRYDLQLGSYNENIPDLLARIQATLGRNGTLPLDTSVLQPAGKRGDFNNFGPRVGLAWDPANNGVTNIHAAWGMFYDNNRTLNNFGELTWPQSQSIVINSPNFLDPLQGKSRDSFISTAPPNVSVMDNHYVSPYAHQVNVGINRMVGNTLGVTADFTTVYRYSDRDTVDINLPVTPGSTIKPFPQFGRVSFWQATRDNTYRALLLKVEKRMTTKTQFLVS